MSFFKLIQMLFTCCLRPRNVCKSSSKNMMSPAMACYPKRCGAESVSSGARNCTGVDDRWLRLTLYYLQVAKPSYLIVYKNHTGSPNRLLCPFFFSPAFWGHQSCLWGVKRRCSPSSVNWAFPKHRREIGKALPGLFWTSLEIQSKWNYINSWNRISYLYTKHR